MAILVTGRRLRVPRLVVEEILELALLLGGLGGVYGVRL